MAEAKWGSFLWGSAVWGGIAWVKEVTDRTEADKTELLRVRDKIAASGWNGLTAAEKTYWLSGPKGAYNISDLNRVGENVKYLADRLNTYGYAVAVDEENGLGGVGFPDGNADADLFAECREHDRRVSHAFRHAGAAGRYERPDMGEGKRY